MWALLRDRGHELNWEQACPEQAAEATAVARTERASHPRQPPPGMMESLSPKTARHAGERVTLPRANHTAHCRK